MSSINDINNILKANPNTDGIIQPQNQNSEKN